MDNTKVCTKCKRELNISCFHKNKNNKDGLHYWCKVCVKQYQKDNVEPISKQQKQYRRNNTKIIYKRQKRYKKDNAPQIAKYQKQYNKRKAKQITRQVKQYRKNIALFESYYKKLKIFEEVRFCPKNPKLLEVKCAYCGNWMKPNNNQVNNRLQVFRGTTPGEHRFYCSENCKQSCPIYHKRLWPKGFKKATSREVVPLLRQLVLKRDDYTCQKCWKTIEERELHVHHEKSYTLNKIMANDPDNCITLCKDCHNWIHSQEGCQYSDLKC